MNESCVMIDCDKNAGLTFIKSNTITLQNLVFTGCGVPNNSTSMDYSLAPFSIAFFQVKSTLYFFLCHTVTLANITIQHSDGTGVVMYSTVGNNTITGSKFIANKPPNSFNGGGGLYIEFSYCYPGNTSCFEGPSNIPKDYTSGANFVISDSVFADNLANISHTTDYIFVLPQKWNHLAFGRGGGLSIFFKGQATNNNVKVVGSQFINNTALWGAGVFVEHQDYSTNNSVVIENSIVTGNECLYKNSSSQGTGGGGTRVGFVFFYDTHAKHNSILFRSCSFSNNSAFFGGGVSFYAAREPGESTPTNSLAFESTTWLGNVARVGSGADLSDWHLIPHGAVSTVNFTNCTFTGNNCFYTKEPNTIVGIGALYINAIPVYFLGKNTFESNTHSALAAISTGIYLTTNSSLNFTNNTGRRGAAIALLGAVFLQTSPQSRVMFINNTAAIEGGAIYQYSIGEHDLLNSRNCFIRYSNITVKPENWKSSFYFSGNHANQRNNSIHVTTLLICQWGAGFGNSSQQFSRVFCWSESWNYAGNDCKSEVHTSPAFFDSSSSFKFDVIPGRRREMPLTMLDDRGSDVTSSSILIAKSLSEGMYIDTSSEYISDNHIEVHASDVNNVLNNGGSILLETVDPRVIQIKLNVSVLPCPPGMVLRGSENSSSCECGGSFNGILECDATSFSTRLQQGNWIGTYMHGNVAKTVASGTPYFSTDDNLFIQLPNNADELDRTLCQNIHRNGTLCGHCQQGYGPSLHTLECVYCDARYTWVYYLLSQYLPLTVLFIVVIVLDIRITSATANAFIFFAQVIPTVFTLDGGGAIRVKNINGYFADAYTILYDIWNLKFFSLNICLSPNISSLQVISITYLEAAYPLALICMVSLLVWLYERGCRVIVCVFRPMHRLVARFQQQSNIQRSLIHAFASFILLSYSRFVLVSFLLLTTTPLTTEDGGTFGGGVVFYDGNIPYLSAKHAPFVALSALVLMSFVLITPLLLIVPSLFRNLSIIRGRWPRLACMLPDVNKCYNSCFDWPKLNSFLEAFHGCYRDGTNATAQSPEFDYRCCAGLYLVLRVVIIALYAFTPEWFIQYSFLQFICVTVILVLVVFRPYKNDFYNKWDATVFAILVAINTLTMYNYYKTAIGSQPSKSVFILQYILIFLPLVYIVLVVLRYLYHCVCVCCRRRRRYYIDDLEEEEGLVQNDTDERGAQAAVNDGYLSFMEGTGRLHNVNVYRPASAGSDSGLEQASNDSSNGGTTKTSTMSLPQTNSNTTTSSAANLSSGVSIYKGNDVQTNPTSSGAVCLSVRGGHITSGSGGSGRSGGPGGHDGRRSYGSLKIRLGKNDSKSKDT